MKEEVYQATNVASSTLVKIRERGTRKAIKLRSLQFGGDGENNQIGGEGKIGLMRN